MRAGLKCAIEVKQSRFSVDPGLQKDAMPRVFRRGENEPSRPQDSRGRYSLFALFAALRRIDIFLHELCF